MPNIWTHILFVDQLCKNLHRDDLLQTSSPTLHMGAQGPDPFFYHNFLPFLPDKKVADLGMTLHTENCGSFLLAMIEQGKNEKHVLQSYTLGFVSHHILDRHTHPYIHYHAGYVGNKHQELEVLIDTMMLKRERSMKSWKNPVHKEIKVGTHVHLIADLLHVLMIKHFPSVADRYNKKVIYQSLLHIQAAQRVLYDPWKWKNKWFGTLVSSFSHQPIFENRDYLNEDRKEWRHPATNEKRCESFLDLYKRALEEGHQLFQYIFKYWEDGSPETLEVIENIIGNVSYDTGESLEHKWTNRYSRPIV